MVSKLVLKSKIPMASIICMAVIFSACSLEPSKNSVLSSSTVVAAPRNFRQTIINLERSMGIRMSTASKDIAAVFLPQTSDTTVANASTVLATITAVGEACDDLIDKEAVLTPPTNPQRVFFVGFNFNSGPQNTTDASIEQAVRVLAKKVGAMEISGGEVAEFRAMGRRIQSLDATPTAALTTRKVALGICTAIGASAYSTTIR